MANCMMLVSTVMAPTAMSPPYWYSDALKHTAIRLSVDCMINGDMPSARQGSTTFALGRSSSRRSRHLVFFPSKNRSTHIMDTAWDKMVARAAPRTPKLNPKIKIGSRIVFKIAPMSTVFMLTVVKPWAVMNAFIPRVISTKAVPSA